MKQTETGDMKVGELVKKVHVNESKGTRIVRSARFGQEECMKREQDAMLAEVGEESDFIKCVDDTIGEELGRL